MILVETLDKDGYKHLIWRKEKDQTVGLSADPPFLGQLDYNEIEKELHNMLVDRRLTNWREVQKQQNSIGGIVSSVVTKRIIALYRQAEKEA